MEAWTHPLSNDSMLPLQQKEDKKEVHRKKWQQTLKKEGTVA